MFLLTGQTTSDVDKSHLLPLELLAPPPFNHQLTALNIKDTLLRLSGGLNSIATQQYNLIKTEEPLAYSLIYRVDHLAFPTK